ncbi:hypothetical protein WCO01_20220 [Weissella confusa]|nr:hypothetical protein WCO01_20220 [Weissella confusa]
MNVSNTKSFDTTTTDRLKINVVTNGMTNQTIERIINPTVKPCFFNACIPELIKGAKNTITK